MEAPPSLYTLVTVPTVPKYVGPVAALLAKLDMNFALLLKYLGIIEPEQSVGHVAGANFPVFISGVHS